MKLIGFTLVALSLSAATLMVAASPNQPSESRASGADNFSVDSTHSNVVFRTNHLGISEFFGRFNSVTGEVNFDADKPENCSILVEIPVASLDTNSAQRDGHLKSADFFSAKEFPTMIFESSAVQMDGDDMQVTGQLTLRDVSREVTATFRKIGEGEAMGAYRLGFSAELSVDMREFGFQFVKQQPGAVGPEVQIWIALELTKN